MPVRELELELDAFEGPFDLLLTLLLKEELEPREIDIAGIVLAFVERMAERDELDLEACGEFLVLVSALLELKARALFPEEAAELGELEPEEAAEELARRLAEYRRMKEAPAWLPSASAASATASSGRARAARAAFRARLAPQDPAALGDAIRALAAPPPTVSLAHMALRFPPVSQFLERFRALLCRRRALRFRPRGGGAVARRAGGRTPRAARAAQGGRDHAEPGAAVRPDKGFQSRQRKDSRMESTLRLISANPARPLSPARWRRCSSSRRRRSPSKSSAEATDDDPERIETAVGLLRERYAEGRSGIVLEEVAGGYAFRASREAADACARMFERPVERGLSPAALETLAIVAYLGPCSRPDVARIRGVAADSAVASLVERGLIAEAGRETGGAVRYRTTPLFERVFGLESLAALPRLDDLGADATELRERLLEVAEARAS